MMNRTGRVGQLCANDGALAEISTAKAQKTRARRRCSDWRIVFSWRIITDNYLKQANAVVQHSMAHARMHWLSIGRASIAPIRRALAAELLSFFSRQDFCTAKFSAKQYFVTHDQALASSCRRHSRYA
jgi:hypothetical protein